MYIWGLFIDGPNFITLKIVFPIYCVLSAVAWHKFCKQRLWMKTAVLGGWEEMPFSVEEAQRFVSIFAVEE
jgi:hypothetical protein